MNWSWNYTDSSPFPPWSETTVVYWYTPSILVFQCSSHMADNLYVLLSSFSTTHDISKLTHLSTSNNHCEDSNFNCRMLISRTWMSDYSIPLPTTAQDIQVTRGHLVQCTPQMLSISCEHNFRNVISNQVQKQVCITLNLLYSIHFPTWGLILKSYWTEIHTWIFIKIWYSFLSLRFI